MSRILNFDIKTVQQLEKTWRFLSVAILASRYTLAESVLFALRVCVSC